MNDSSILSIFIISLSCFTNSPIGTGLFFSLLAFTAVLRKFAMLTPGTSLGYWNERNSPFLALSFVGIVVMSSPLNIIRPFVILYVGWARRAKPSDVFLALLFQARSFCLSRFKSHYSFLRCP